MYETKSKLKYCQDIVEEFNKKSDKWVAKVLGIMTGNMSIHCESIKIKENRFFGKSLHIDYWDSGFFDVRVSGDFDLEPYKEPIRLLEKISGKELQVTRTGKI